MHTVSSGTTDALPPRATRREWIGLSVLALACLLYVMDLTVLHLAVPSISADLKPTSTELLWIIDVYGFFVAGSLVTMGTLGDRIGRRRLLLFGACMFGAASVFAAFSTSATMLIVARAVLGIAGATIAPSTLSLIFHMFQDPKQRSIAVGVWIGSFSAGSAIGPVVGGALLEVFWWGSVFLIALPVMAALLLLGRWALPEYRDPEAGRLDLRSAAMSITALLAMIYGLKQVAQDGLTTAPVLAIVFGIAVGVAWVRRQQRLDDPMIDVALFRIKAFNAALTVNFFSVLVAFGYFLFIAQYLQLVVGLSPLHAGLWSLPSAVAFIVASQFASRLVHRTQPAYVIAAGIGTSAVGLAVLATVAVEGGLPALVAASVVVSLGLAPVFGLTTELSVGSAPPERASTASGIAETAAELGGALGIATLGTLGAAIYQRDMAAGLPAGLPSSMAAEASDTLGAAVGAAGRLPHDAAAELLAVAREAFVHGMRVTAGVAACVAVVVAIGAFRALRSPPAAASIDSEAGAPTAEGTGFTEQAPLVQAWPALAAAGGTPDDAGAHGALCEAVRDE